MSSTDSPNNQLNSLTQNPNQSFIQLFFAKPNDILRFPLFFEDNPRRLEAIRARGGLSDFSPAVSWDLRIIPPVNYPLFSEKSNAATQLTR